MADRTVIFVCSCSYSGSTLLNLMLASNKSSFATGEISFAFHPRKAHHLSIRCGCGDSDCDIWPSLIKGKPENIHSLIMDKYGKRLVVDSSKEPWWVEKRSSELEKSGVRVIKLIVWKTPLEIIDSFSKRGKRKQWSKHWVNYHRNIFSSGNDWHSVPYNKLAKNPSLISDLLDYENLPSRKDQHEYWNHENHPVFGNDTAILHLHDEKSQTAKEVRQRLVEKKGEEEIRTHREISYSHDLDSSHREHDGPKIVDKIVEALEDRIHPSIGEPSYKLDPQELSFSRIQRIYRSIFRRVEMYRFRLLQAILTLSR